MFWLKNKTVLITGGTGSFGKKCARFLLENSEVKRLIIFSRDEQKHVDMRRNLFPTDKYPQIRYFIGDVRDDARLRRAFKDKRSTAYKGIIRTLGARRPLVRAVLLENVASIETHDNGNSLVKILADLHACGYRAIWRKFFASDV